MIEPPLLAGAFHETVAEPVAEPVEFGIVATTLVGASAVADEADPAPKKHTANRPTKPTRIDAINRRNHWCPTNFGLPSCSLRTALLSKTPQTATANIRRRRRG